MMYRTLLFAGVIFTSTVPALAQTTSPTPPAPPPVSVNPSTTDIFYLDAGTTWRASDAMGKPVYNAQNEKIGDVDELLVSADGKIVAAVLGVGGFLGIGEKSVAVTYNAFKMTQDTSGKSKLMLDLPKASLQNAPDFRAATPRTKS
jgi:PRC-barrel domain